MHQFLRQRSPGSGGVLRRRQREEPRRLLATLRGLHISVRQMLVNQRSVEMVQSFFREDRSASIILPTDELIRWSKHAQSLLSFTLLFVFSGVIRPLRKKEKLTRETEGKKPCHRTTEKVKLS